MTKPRILLFDLETAPLIGYAWRQYDTNLAMVKQDWYLLSMAWQWLGDGPVQVMAQSDDPGYYPGSTDDYEMAVRLQELLDEADMVIAHNVVSFDVPKAQTRIAYWGLDVPSPFKTFDTLQVARRHFAFTSNRLDDLCQFLGLGQKVKHSGIDLWDKCLAGDEKAWALMKRYNKHDVVLLRRLYEKLRGWAPVHPNLAALSDKPDACPRCLAPASKLRSRGWKFANVTKRRQFQCSNCGGYCSGRAISKLDVNRV